MYKFFQNSQEDAGRQLFPGVLFYAVLAAIGLFNLMWVWWRGVAFDPGGVFCIVIPTLLTGALAAGWRRLGRYFDRVLPLESQAEGRLYCDRMILLFDGLFFVGLTLIVLPLFNHLTMMTRFPYADAFLIHADRALGLNWPAFFAAAARFPSVLKILFLSYVVLTPVTMIGFLTLLLTGQRRRASFFIAGYLVCAVICLVIGLYFPAKGPLAVMLDDQARRHYGPLLEIGLLHIPHLAVLKDVNPVVIDFSDLPGLISLPSFHTAAVMVFAWTWRRTRMLLPAILYSAVMIAGTAAIGGHYFIDLIGGAVVAACVIAVLQKLPLYRPLFT